MLKLTSVKLLNGLYKQFKIKFYVDSGTDYGLSILILRENIDYLKLRSNKIILNRFCKPLEAAKVCKFFASDMASYVTGQTIFVDGGYSIL